MKQIPGTIYQAFDGVLFVDEKACVEYEAQNWRLLLVGLTIEQVDAAIDRLDTNRADSFEKAGQRIARKRLADGERRRKAPNPPADADALARVEESKLLITAIPNDRDDVWEEQT
jgi:hypothetical protein